MGNSSSSRLSREKGRHHSGTKAHQKNEQTRRQEAFPIVTQVSVQDQLILVKGASPLVAFSFVNQVLGSLTRLPDNVLVDIMTLLEPQEMTRLRHVSRDFMRLFDQHPRFEKYHTRAKTNWLASAPWAVPDPLFFFPGQPVSHNASLCGSCAKLRGDDRLGKQLLASMPVLYCSVCNAQHRIMHFSKYQREGCTDADRVCLGHEGCIQIGKFLICSWRQAVAMSRSPSHVAVRYVRQNALCCKERLCTFPPASGLQFKALRGGKMHMTVVRNFHIPFKRQLGGKVSLAALWKACEELHRQERDRSPLDRLCFDARDMLRAFDPHVCSCVDWGQPASYSSRTGRTFEWPLAAPPRGPGRQPIDRAYVGKQGRCLGRQHGFSSPYAMGTYEVDLLLCADDADMLVVQAVFRSVVSSPMDPAWRCNLSFDSCMYMLDEDMRGITWCDDKTNCGVASANSRHQSLMELEWKYGL